MLVNRYVQETSYITIQRLPYVVKEKDRNTDYGS